MKKKTYKKQNKEFHVRRIITVSVSRKKKRMKIEEYRHKNQLDIVAGINYILPIS